ncbi:hypothetical protein GPECTOR_39g468 [Gonium pectorale]|uniref:Uncharacterized protein n=1 Tax=Gonium pectorale TaxID=33097 RepID=A0A150GAX6_GONPE|nr:hypothetical protein GPECTOR_39g468 [Gonium pectorale]|eukprot:KXZ46974.1 hypothetical protein GPECTOR_39g468 [Gonium pectorale]
MAAAYQPVPIPRGPQPAGNGVFRPEAYSYWVQVLGGQKANTNALQQLTLNVTSEPCPGGIFVFTCTYAEA